MRTLFLTLIALLLTTSGAWGRQPDFVVAKDGSGNFKTVQEAISAVPDFRKKETVIYIKKGIYKEKLILPATKINVHFIGEDADSVVLTYDDYAARKNIFGEEIGTSGSASFFIHGDGFTAEQISFANSAGPVGQAVAVRVAADRVRFFGCKFLGFQDTLYTWAQGGAGRQYYKDCYIEGTVDFIFGSSTAVFETCRIFGKGPGYLTAASTPDTARYGYVFIHCRIEGNAPDATIYLGRPWRPYAKTVWIGCEMAAVVRPEGWHNWGKPGAEKTTFYAEYRSRGKGAAKTKRVAWAHPLTGQQAAAYTPARIFRGWEEYRK
ncbi:pectinesterase family protein [Niabella aurantiaca]|uniref:pectinesterase family protein n=1 Tax=Niabella aurantiaca TaxID=379900 RepID=UPI00036F6FE2|nr:pectinesterase family protein [Niabella aurantiaca]